MFSQFFGNYLLKHKKINDDQFDTCMEYMRANRVKLGLIAESAGLLTPGQSDELNQLQMQTDKRFGDLAVEKGYLTEEDVAHLLKLQGNPYLIFVQALEETGVMERREALELVPDFQKELGISDTALEAMKTGDFDTLIPEFIPDRENPNIALVSLALRNIVRFVSSYIRFDKAEKITEYSAKYLAYQKTIGAYDGFLGFASNDDSILMVASGFAGEYFEKADEDALDSVCEFTNCINGLHATELSFTDIVIDMMPPEFTFDGGIQDSGGFFLLPLYITGKRVDLIFKI